MKIIVAVLLLVLFFLIRLFPYLGKKIQSPDGSYFLKLIKEYRKSKKFPPEFSNFLLENDRSYYPPVFWLFPVVTGFVNLKSWKKLYIPLIETTHFLLLICVMLRLEINSAQMVLGALVFMSFPIVVKESNYFSSRSLGNLLTTIFFISFMSLFFGGELLYFYFAFTSVVISLTALTHKMSLQFQIAMILFMSIVDTSLSYFLLIPTSLGLAWLISGGHYINVLRHHFGIVKFWNHNYPLLRADPVRWISGRGDHPEDEIEAFKQQSIFSQIHWIKDRFEKTLWSLSGGYIWLFGICVWLNFELVNSVVLWILGAIAIMLCLDAFPWFRALGEGFKYTRYLAFPMAMLFSSIDSWRSVAIAIPFVLLNLENSRKIILKRREQSNEKFHKGLRPILEFIKEHDCKRIYCLPLNQADDVVLYTDSRVFSGGHSYPYGPKLLDFFPVQRMPYRNLFNQYSVNYVLVDRQKQRAIELVLKEKVDILLKNKSYLFMEIQTENKQAVDSE